MPSVTVAKGGQFCKLTGGGYTCPPDEDNGGGRGEVRGFSRESRKRLIDLIHQVDRSALTPPLFICLTYPGAYPDDWQVWKAHLDAWDKRVRRKFPGASFLWRLEFQRRGAPHYHVLLFGVPFVPAQWLARSWYEVVSSGDDKHLSAGTEVSQVRSWRGASFYVAKYLGKSCEYGSTPTGRMWGVRGELPIDLFDVDLDWHAWHKVRRVLRTFYEKRTGRPAWWCAQRRSGITAYLPERDAARLLAWAVVDD